MGYGINASVDGVDILTSEDLEDKTVVSSNNIAKIYSEGTFSGTYHAAVGDSTSQFDITNPNGNTFRYTYDGTGTDPGLTGYFIVGDTVSISGVNFNSNNNGNFTVTGIGTNYFEINNASGVAENNVTLGSFLGNDGFIWNITDMTITESIVHNLGYKPIVRLYVTDDFIDRWHIAPAGIEDFGNVLYAAGYEHISTNRVDFTLKNQAIAPDYAVEDYVLTGKYYIYLEPEENPWYE